MTSNPTYDYPEPYANPRQGAVAFVHNISLMGRLRLTQPVWLQLGINSATALHILQREPAGTFLVRRSSTHQCQVLCLRLLDDSAPAFVTTYRLHQERAAITLEGSDQSFPTLLHLVAFYCSVPDVLPLALRLPQPIWEAASCQQLEAIAHLGLEFWNSSLNAKGSTRLASSGSSFSMGTASPCPPPRAPQGLNISQVGRGQPTQACGLPTPPLEGPSLEDVSVRRQYFKSNVKVQVSTEAVSPLSPPAAPPPPIPVGKKKTKPAPPPQPPASDGKGQFSDCNFQFLSTDKAVYGDACGGEIFAPSASLGQLLGMMEEEQAEGPSRECSPWPPVAQDGGETGPRSRELHFQPI
ncbi:ras and Rab interactor 1 [Candoia aspera]|uniref:ras and Rab interactor 1 n=1 Tax=Candoia aspera TaxID=51853 RepID=UPI002FD7EA75